MINETSRGELIKYSQKVKNHILKKGLRDFRKPFCLFGSGGGS